MIFRRFSVARNCLRPKTVPLTIMAIKRGLLCNFAKTFQSCHFMGQSSTGLKFSVTIEFYIFKTSFAQFFKKYVKNNYFGPKEKRPFFSNFALYSKCHHFSITRFDILIFCNILHFEMNFGNFH